MVQNVLLGATAASPRLRHKNKAISPKAAKSTLGLAHMLKSVFPQTTVICSSGQFVRYRGGGD